MRTNQRIASSVVLALFGVACQSTGPRATGPVDDAARKSLFDPVKALAGNWQRTDEKGETDSTQFAVTAAGTSVREVMFPGTPHEMTNMYHLDGNALVVTHYCAGGNQPRMRARAREGNKIAFHFDSVSDLRDANGEYMGELTLEFVDADHFVEHWRSYAKGTTSGELELRWTRQR